MPTAQLDTTLLASRLRVALGHLIRRLRAERHRFSLSQASVLGRLDRYGPSSIGDLASVAYGLLPKGLYEQVRRELVASIKARQSHVVRRTE